MGGCSGREKERYLDYGFTDEELEAIAAIFDELSEQKSKTWRRGTIGKKALRTVMLENKEFSEKYYNWLKYISPINKADFDAHIVALQLLAKNFTRHHYKRHPTYHFEKLEIFAMISMQKFDNLSAIHITFTEAVKLFSEIFNAFRADPKNQLSASNELSARITASSIFRSDERSMDLRNFVFRAKQQFPQVNEVIRIYFESKFIHKEVAIKIPHIDLENQILSEDLLPLFYISNQFFRSVPSMTLLYSFERDGIDFAKLANSLKGYDAPTMLLVKHVDSVEGKESFAVEENVSVFGGLSRKMWLDDTLPFGDIDTQLFSLIPRYRSYPVQLKQKDNIGMTYLNTRENKGNPLGIGFGRTSDRKGFRLWIDWDILNKSYCIPEDDVFEQGYLVDEGVQRLNIVEIEVWGFGNMETLRKQEQFLSQELYKTRDSRLAKDNRLSASQGLPSSSRKEYVQEQIKMTPAPMVRMESNPVFVKKTNSINYDEPMARSTYSTPSQGFKFESDDLERKFRQSMISSNKPSKQVTFQNDYQVNPYNKNLFSQISDSMNDLE